MIYLDNAATTWPKPETVYRAVDECLRAGGSAGRGEHVLAKSANYLLYEAREKLAGLFNIENPNNIVFTNNATDALNTAILGLFKPGDKVITTSMEHNSVSRPLRWLEHQGVDLEIIHCNSDGEIDLAVLEARLRQGARALVMSHASNVVGTVMPIEYIGQLTNKYNAIFILDAAQTAGNKMIDVQKQSIDILAFSGHKGLLGPQGTGGLYIRDNITIRPLRFGGTGSRSEDDFQPDFLPDMLESGTMNLLGIAGLLAGVNFILQTGIEKIAEREAYLSNKLINGLGKMEKITIYAKNVTSRTGVVSFNLENQDSGEIAYILSQNYGIACRAGLHCAPWAHKTLGTLRTGTIRLSPGYFTTDQEIDKAIKAIKIISGRRNGIL